MISFKAKLPKSASILITTILIIAFFLGIKVFAFIFFILFITLLIISRHDTKKYTRLERNLATSKIGSMAMGLIEVKGRIYPANDSISSYGRKKKCIAYFYEKYRYDGSDEEGRPKYTLIFQKQKISALYIEDETGRAKIDENNLSIIGLKPNSFDLPNGDYYKESYLLAGDEMLLIGMASQHSGELFIEKDPHKNILTMRDYESVKLSRQIYQFKRPFFLYLLTLFLLIAIILTSPYNFDGHHLTFFFSQSPLLHWIF